jgi:hypothetical protein
LFIVSTDNLFAPKNKLDGIACTVEPKNNDKFETPRPDSALFPMVDKLPRINRLDKEEHPEKAPDSIFNILAGIVFGGLSFIIKVDNLFAPKNKLDEIVCTVESIRNDNNLRPVLENADDPTIFRFPSVDK